jgi:CRISPR type IV-associated DEAD/DEAH-box helicase Csf4
MNITILVPNAWLSALGLAEHLQVDALEVARFTRDLLVQILSGPLGHAVADELSQPQPSHEGTSVRMTIGIPQSAASTLQALANHAELTPGPTAKRLLGMAARGEISLPESTLNEKSLPPSHPMVVLNAALGFEARLAQATVYDNLWESITGNFVGLVEGGTGVGKTRAMLAAATRWVTERKVNVGICAPTIALLRQLAQEHQFQFDKGIDVPPIRMFIGRREYVSEVELTEFLAGNGAHWDTPKVRDWMVNGLHASHDAVMDVSWQVHSLLCVAPDFPVDEVRLSEVNFVHDRGFKAYRIQFDAKLDADDTDAQTPSILLFTHAMLAQDMRRKLLLASQDDTYQEMQRAYNEALKHIKGKKRKDSAVTTEFDEVALIESELGVALNTAVDGKSILPMFSCLFVDEGHQLEESFSSAMSDYLSLRSLAQNLRDFKALGGTVPNDGVGIVERALATLINDAPKLDRRDFVALSGDANGSLTNQLTAMSVVCGTISKVRDKQSEKFRLSLKIRRAGLLLNAAVSKSRSFAFIRHSPVRRLPQLMVSNASIHTILSRLWSGLEGSCIVSATLYTSTMDGPSGNFMAGLLRIPLDRLKTFAPVSAPWSTSCVQGVWLPETQSDWLHPPTATWGGVKRTQSESLQREASWHAELAQSLRKIWKDSDGGILVLCTSYATVNALHGLLNAEGDPLSTGLIKAVPKVSVASQASAFLHHCKEGKKALWLGVGSAWTGVDIGGHDPWRNIFGEALDASVDNVLTTLVIPRVPYGTNQSMSHLWRIRNNPNVPWDLFDAALKFKQALGRLVRREGLASNRRIYVLDARLSNPLLNGQHGPFLRSLDRYRKHVFLGGE